MVDFTSSPAHRPQIAKSPQRSRITNGKLLPGDNRGAWVRRCKDVISELLSDAQNASAAERSIIRRASVLTVELEQLEAKFALAGEASTEQLDLYQRCSSSLRRLLEAIGLQRRPRDVTPNLSQYLAIKEQQEQRDGDSD
jgi:hypothetical protein